MGLDRWLRGLFPSCLRLSGRFLGPYLLFGVLSNLPHQAAAVAAAQHQQMEDAAAQIASYPR